MSVLSDVANAYNARQRLRARHRRICQQQKRFRSVSIAALKTYIATGDPIQRAAARKEIARRNK